METPVMEQEKPKVRFDEEPLISFIVPVHANNLDAPTLKRCLLSLDEQDYPNMEVIVVLNGGEDKNLEKTVQFFVDQDSKYRLIKEETPGACHARNVGFYHSKGEIVSFFNSDYRLKPGMARLWVETLIKNPDCGFAYGGYEYASSPAVPYWSKPFDVYQLTQANYIDCGFPLWRKYFVEWDPEVKSLQDWDFWLRVVKTHKVKGHYMEGDTTFIAELPRKGGLSMDSANNWVERVKFVKNKNNIHMSPLLVTSLGAPFHAAEISKILKAEFRGGDTIYKPNDYKALYMIGFYLKPGDQGNEHPRILASFSPEVKKIIHFVGADIYWLRKFPYDALKIMSGVMRMGSHHILCENEIAQKELDDMGIKAEIVPIPTYNEFEYRPLPNKFKVAIYLTDKSDFDKYVQFHTLSIVRAMPDVEFSGYGDGAKNFNTPNFKHYGNIPIKEFKNFVYDHSAVLRLVRHDTLPMAACDFFQAGRHVISNIPMRYGLYINTKGKEPINEWDMYAPGFSNLNWPKTKKEIVRDIRNVRDHAEVYTKVLREASKYWIKHLDRKKYIKTISKMSGVNCA